MSREKFAALVEKDVPRKADCVFLLEGDGYNRVPYAAHLYFEGFAPLIATVGNDVRREYGSFPSGELKQKLLELHIPESAILCEEVAPHTKAEAERAMELARERGWKTILITTSPHHQYRAFLTFLRAMQKAELDLILVNTCAPLSLDEQNPWGTRRDLTQSEMEKIEQYQSTGDVASFDEGLQYLEARI